MGCGSSKDKDSEPNSEDDDQRNEDDTDSEKDKKKGKDKNKKGIEPAGCGGQSQSRDEYANLVREALKKNKTAFTTIRDIETYISQNYRSTVDAFNRRKIIQKVVSDEFQSGQLTIRSIKGNCI